jgi:hypothetical protein
MTDRPLDHPRAGSPDPDPTRDIRLPQLPGRPPSSLPPEWVAAAEVPVEPVVPVQPVAPGQPVVPEASPVAAPGPLSSPALSAADAIADEPTDHLAPPVEQPRQRTLAFEPVPGDEPAGSVQAPFGALGQVGPAVREQPPVVVPSVPAAGARRPPQPRRERDGSRRSTWVLLVLLPIVVIAAAGLLLFYLLNGG